MYEVRNAKCEHTYISEANCNIKQTVPRAAHIMRGKHTNRKLRSRSNGTECIGV